MRNLKPLKGTLPASQQSRLVNLPAWLRVNSTPANAPGQIPEALPGSSTVPARQVSRASCVCCKVDSSLQRENDMLIRTESFEVEAHRYAGRLLGVYLRVGSRDWWLVI